MMQFNFDFKKLQFTIFVLNVYNLYLNSTIYVYVFTKINTSLEHFLFATTQAM